MSQHDHRELVEGCYRCDLSRDEAREAYFERDDEGIAHAVARGECAEPGPWATVCTEDVAHRYSHYDASDDSSWQDDWREYAPDDEEGQTSAERDSEARRMTLTGFKAKNHPQQTGARGALDEIDDRGTHPDYFAPWNERFGGFTLDVAAAPHNAKCERYFTRADDGLAQSWAGERVWCNPPYSDLYAWVAKAWAEWVNTRGIVMLLPANRVEQRWWQELVEPYRDRPGEPLSVEFLPGRMRFIRPGAVIGPKGDRPAVRLLPTHLAGASRCRDSETEQWLSGCTR